jgi:type VI secretion system protein ImpK
VFYICVVLGFRGLYSDASATSHARDFDLPQTLNDWMRRTSMSIQVGQGRPRLIEQGRPGPGAPPLEGKYLLIGSGVFCVLLFVVALYTARKVFWAEV